MAVKVNVSEPAGISFLRAVYQWNWKIAYRTLNGTSMYEMLRLLDQIDRLDLAAFSGARANSQHEVNMPRIDFAIRTVLERRVPSSTATADQAEARKFLEARNPLVIPADPTGFMPPPTINPARLTEDDFEAAAQELEVEPAMVKAVAYVEGGSRGFGDDGRPLVRYELHIFDRRTNHQYRRTHPHLSQGSRATGDKYHTKSQANEWSMLYGASMLRYRDKDAICSTSFGMFQIMGFNAARAGWPNVYDFVYAMFESEYQQLLGFLAFCKSGGLVRHMRNKDYAAFAYGYNGPTYAQGNYHGQIRAAYQRFSRAAQQRAAQQR